METGKFTISINELIGVFREALISIIPTLERVKIEWQQSKSYDDWDNISKALYENIVCSSIYSEVSDSYPIGKYDFGYKDYSKLDYILVSSIEHPGEKHAFVSFESIKSPLDHVSVARLDDDERLICRLELKKENLNYTFNRLKMGNRELMAEIEVIL